MWFFPHTRSYPTTIGYPANKERAKLARVCLNWIPTFVGMSGMLGMLSACDVQLQNFTDAASSDPVVEKVVEKVVEEDKSVEALPAAHVEDAPKPPEITIIQDGVDAFLGYKHIEVPENLNGIYPTLNEGILAFILAFNLREMANEEGVSAWAKIRTSSAGETTWQYELSSLPDDAVYATDYKVYFGKIDTDYQIARIGHRVKCYQGENPKQWTIEPCGTKIGGSDD